MNHASLFSGLGGFDLAAEWAGWDNVFHCEINETTKAAGNAIVPQVALNIFKSINDYEKTSRINERGDSKDSPRNDKRKG